MKSGASWEPDFPIRQEMEDCAGKLRVFEITCHETDLGYIVRAEEVGRDGLGYEFSSFSETTPYSALGHVRVKMQRLLAMRHISRRSVGGYGMLHDRLRGRITCDDERRAVLVVDGIPLAMEDLERMLLTHEGWSFELRIMDRNDGPC